MEEFDSAFLAGIQKSNYLNVHERYALHIKHNRWAFDAGLFLQFLDMFRSNSPNQPDQDSALIRARLWPYARGTEQRPRARERNSEENTV
jgi:hypothetical protein